MWRDGRVDGRAAAVATACRVGSERQLWGGQVLPGARAGAALIGGSHHTKETVQVRWSFCAQGATRLATSSRAFREPVGGGQVRRRGKGLGYVWGGIGAWAAFWRGGEGGSRANGRRIPAFSGCSARSGRNAPYVRAAAALAGRLGLPVVATHPVQFVKAEEYTAHEARVCIAQGWVLGDARRPRDFRPSQYFKTQAEMAVLFADLPEALENSVEIARRCAFEFSLGKTRLPDFPKPEGVAVGDYLRELALEGLGRHLAEATRAGRRGPGPYLSASTTSKNRPMATPYFHVGFIMGEEERVSGGGAGSGGHVWLDARITAGPLRTSSLRALPTSGVDAHLNRLCQEGRDRRSRYVRDKYGAQGLQNATSHEGVQGRGALRRRVWDGTGGRPNAKHFLPVATRSKRRCVRAAAQDPSRAGVGRRAHALGGPDVLAKTSRRVRRPHRPASSPTSGLLRGSRSRRAVRPGRVEKAGVS